MPERGLSHSRRAKSFPHQSVSSTPPLCSPRCLFSHDDLPYSLLLWSPIEVGVKCQSSVSFENFISQDRSSRVVRSICTIRRLSPLPRLMVTLLTTYRHFTEKSNTYFNASSIELTNGSSKEVHIYGHTADRQQKQATCSVVSCCSLSLIFTTDLPENVQCRAQQLFR